MKTINIILNLSLFLILFCSFAKAAPVVDELIAADLTHLNLPYPMVPLSISTVIDGVEVLKEGTFHGILAELAAEFPHHDPFNSIIAKDEAAVEKRNLEALFCIPVAGWGWRDTGLNNAYAMEQDFKNMNWNIQLIPRACMVVGFRPAVDNSYFFGCNDNFAPVLASYPTLAGYMDNIVRNCDVYDPGTQSYFTGGQQFSDQGWNVILKSDA